MIFQDRYDPLAKACRQMLNYRQTFARPAFERSVLRRVGPELSNPELLAHIVSESVMSRLDRRMIEAKNIYVQDFDIAQIVMFYKMGLAYPHIFMSHSIANQYLLSDLEGLREATVWDIGVGQGRQMQQLVEAASARYPGLRRLNILGLDPDPQNLIDARAAIESTRDKVHFDLEFHAIEGLLEDMSMEALAEVRTLAQGNLLINASYTLHHTIHAIDDDRLRTTLLERLYTLEPRLLTLIEPSSDHDTEDIAQRFSACWQHFGTVFDLIDETTEVDPETRFAIKEKFFGREIRDIFGVSDHYRCERHEPYESWLLRLARAKFVPYTFSDLDIDLPSHSPFDVSDGLVRLGYRDLTLISVFAYTHPNVSRGS